MFDVSKGYNVLGKGAQAIVISVHTTDGREVAIKKPTHSKEKVQAASGIINMKELYILSHLKHPYVQSAEHIFFRDPFETRGYEIDYEITFDRVFFVMEKAEYSMHELIHDKVCVVSTMKRAMFQTTCAVQYLHGQGICHRDIKPGNILCYFNKGVLTCKLADFGMTKPLNVVSQNSLHAGTSYYRAPEVIMQNKHYGYEVDVWALACTFFEMISGEALFKADTEIQLLMKIFMRLGSPSKETIDYMCDPGFKVKVSDHKRIPMLKLLKLTPNSADSFTTKGDVFNNIHNPGTLAEYCDLLDKMLQIDPRKRLNMDEVLLHDFFKGHFENHPNQHGLWKPDRSTINISHRIKELGNTLLCYPKQHNRSFWEHALIEISNMDEPHDFYTQEISYAIRFLAVDIFNRVLLKMLPENHLIYYRKLAWTSSYISSKYYLDEGSAHLWDLFPESPAYMQPEEIQETEKRIIELLDCEIYRPNLFTFVENPCFYSSLYCLAMYPDYIYGRRLAEVMEKFNYRVKEHCTKHPNSVMPI